MKRTILLSMMAVAMALSAVAQDDMYFVPTKKAIAQEKQAYGMPEDTYYSGSNRSVDEYNRNGSYMVPIDSAGNDIINFEGVQGQYPDSVSGASNDYKYTRQMSRWDGYDAYRAGYNAGRYSSIYNSWYDPWYSSYYYGYYDPWYSPYYYGDYYGYYGWGRPWYGYYGYGGWYDPYYYGGYYGGGYYGGGRNYHPRSIAGGARDYNSGRGGFSNYRGSGSSNSFGGIRSSNGFSNYRDRSNTTARSYNNNSWNETRSSSSNGFGSMRSSGGFSNGGGTRSGGGFSGGGGGGFSGGGSHGGGGGFSGRR